MAIKFLSNQSISGTLLVEGVATFNSNIVTDLNISLVDSTDTTLGRLNIGSSSDLILYHDATNSYIQNSSAGRLRIDSNSLEIRSYTGGELFITADLNGAVTLYYNNIVRLNTTATGTQFPAALVDTAGGVGTSGQILSSTASGVSWINPSTGSITGSGTATRVAFWDTSSSLTSDSNLYWDNTNDRLGIGTDSPDRTLSIVSSDSVVAEFKTTGQTLVDINAATDAASNGIRFLENGTAKMAISYLASGDYFQIGTNWVTGGEKFVVKENGNIGAGVGAQNTAYALEVFSAGADVAKFSGSNATTSSIHINNSRTTVGNTANLKFGASNNTTGGVISSVAGTANGNTADMSFQTINAGTLEERLRLDNTGQIKLSNYGGSGFTGTSAFNLEVDSAGNIIQTTAGGSGSITGSGTATRVAFWSGTTALSSDANLYWDNTNDRLGIGTTAPSTNLEIFDTDTSILTMSHDGGSGAGSRIDFNLINAGVSQPITAQIKATDDGAFRSDIIFTTKSLASGSSALSERMRIDAGGNVGIGTTAPAAKLDLVGGDVTGGLKISEDKTNSSFFAFGADADETRITSSSYGGFKPLTIHTGGAEKMVIGTTGAIKFNAYGNQGFTGTTAYALGVDSNGNVLELEGGDLPGGPYLPLSGGTLTGDLTLGGAPSTLKFLKTSSNDNLANIVVSSDGGTGGKIAIQTKRNGNTPIDALVINDDQDATFAADVFARSLASTASGGYYMIQDASGNTTFPVYSFKDDGNTGMMSASADSLSFVTGGTLALVLNSSQDATFSGDVTVGNSGNINIPTSAAGNANLNFDGTDFKITSNSSSANLKLETSSTTRLTINSSGNVGIGISPIRKLDVNSGTTSDIARFGNDSGNFTLGQTTNLTSLDLAASNAFRIRQAGAVPLSIDTSGNATFAGNVTVGADLIIPEYIYHTGNLTTFFGFPSDNTFKIKTNNAEALTIDSSQDATFAGAITLSGKISGVTAGTANTDAVNFQQLTDAVTGVLVYKGVWDASNGAGGAPDLQAVARQVPGHYYIVSADGNAVPNGTGTTPNEWAVGDWCVFSDQATDAWQKIDNTNILTGAGTGGTIAGWAGSGTSVTLGNSPITFSGTASTFSGDITSAGLTVDYTGNRTGDAGILVTNDGDDWGIKVDKDGTADYGILSQTSGENAIVVRNAAGTDKIKLQGDGDGSFTGSITLGGNLFGNTSNTTELGVYSTNAIKRIRMVQGGELHFGDTTTGAPLGITEGDWDSFSDADRISIYGRSSITFYAGSLSASFVALLNSTGLTVGATTNTIDRSIKVLSGDTKQASLEAYGASQGTGVLYVGQSTTYGGGIVYNGDGSPTFGNVTTDTVSFYRREAGDNYEVFRYGYGGSEVTFLGDITIGSSGASSDKTLNILTGGTKSSVKLMEAGTVYGFSTVYDGATNKFHINRHNNSAAGTAVISLNRDDDNATFSGDARFNSRVRIGDVTGLSNRGTVRIDTRGDEAADLLFGRDTAGTATSWTGVYWGFSSRGSSDSNAFRIYRGGAHSSPYNSETLLLQLNSDLSATFAGSITSGLGNNFDPIIREGRVVSNPAYSFTGDLDTGMFNPNLSNTIAFGTGGVERMRITSAGQIQFNNYGSGSFTGTETYALAVDSSGNIIEFPATSGTVTGSGTATRVAFWVNNNAGGTSTELSSDSNLYWDNTNDRLGVGTNAPAHKLDVQVSGNVARFGDGTRFFRIYTDSDEVSLLADGSVPMKFYTSGSEKMRIDSAGDVKIQTSGADDIKSFTINSSNGSSQVAGFVIENDGANGYINFKAGSGNAAPTTRLTIGNASNSGNVGIGTTAPSQKLQVEGNSWIKGIYYDTSGDAGSSGQVLTSTASGTNWVSAGGTSGFAPMVKFYRSGINSSTYTMIATVNGDNLASIIQMTMTGTSGNVVFACTFDITVNHSQDIHVKSMNGDYSEVTLRITSNNNEDYSIEAKHNGSTSTTAEVCIFPLADEIITPTTTDPGYTGAEYEHTAVEGWRFGGEDGNVESSNVIIDGNVGIGTTIPTFRLVVVGASAADSTIALANTTSSAFWQIQASSAANNLLLIGGGNVGIGTTSPGGKLAISSGGTSTSPTISITNTGSTTFNHSINAFAPNMTSTESNILVFGKAGSTKNSAYIGYRYSGTAGSNDNLLILGHWASDNLMTITGDGKVGIGTGTNSATQKLQVDGNTQLGRNGNNLAGDPQKTIISGQGIEDAGTGNFYGSYGFLELNANTNYTGSARRFAITNGLLANRFAIIRSDSNMATMQLGVAGALPSGSTADFVIDSSGNVGIGTTSPGAKLEIFGTGNSLRLDSAANGSKEILFRNVGTGTATIKTDGDLKLYAEDANKNILFETNGGEAMRINSSRNVGINTTTPQSRLDVRMSNNTTASIGGTISAGSFSGLSFGYSEPGNANYRHSAIVFERDDSGFGDARGKIHLLNSPSGSTSADLGDARLTILPSGNVGIGTTSPAAKLDVLGSSSGVSIRVAGLNADSSAYYYGFMHDAADLQGTTQVNTFYSGGAIKSSTTIADYAGIRIDTPNVSADGAAVTNNYGVYQSSSLQKNYFAGNIGIGTTSPAAKLHIKSTESGPTGIIIENTNNAQSLDLDFWSNAGSAQGRIRYNEGGGSFDFFPNVSASTALTMLYSGNVGINNTNPAYKLEVSGGAISIKGNAPGNSLRLDSIVSGTATSRNALYVDSSNVFQIGNANYTSNNIVRPTKTSNLHVDGTLRVDALSGNAPGETGYGEPSAIIVGSSGGSADTILGNPGAWLDINVGGDDYYIPLYTAG